MTRVRGGWLLGGLFVGALALAAQAAGPDPEQVIRYYRKKANVAPAQKVAVANLRDSAIKGAKQGDLQIGDPPNVKTVAFTVSADGHYVIFGDTEDLTVDPSKAVMAKITLKGEPSRGPDAAKVTVVEFSDFQCPFCSRGYNTIEQQKDITADNLKEKAHAILADAKIDQAKFDDCLDNKKTLDKVKADMAEGSSVGVTGTPSFVVNGRLLVGAQPFEAFKNVIDDELASAK